MSLDDHDTLSFFASVRIYGHLDTGVFLLAGLVARPGSMDISAFHAVLFESFDIFSFGDRFSWSLRFLSWTLVDDVLRVTYSASDDLGSWDAFEFVFEGGRSLLLVDSFGFSLSFWVRLFPLVHCGRAAGI